MIQYLVKYFCNADPKLNAHQYETCKEFFISKDLKCSTALCIFQNLNFIWIFKTLNDNDLSCINLNYKFPNEDFKQMN